MRLRKILAASLCATLLCSCGSVEKREPDPVKTKKATYTTPKPFYISPSEDNIYVLAAGIKKYCPGGDEYKKLETAVWLLKRVKSPKYPNNLRDVVGEITEEPMKLTWK